MSIQKPAILCILDGWGMAPDNEGNAITQAFPPTFNMLLKKFPNCRLEASGIGVGLPAEQDGNTETGHLNIGAGRIVYQSLARINMSIADGSFFSNSAFLTAIDHVKKNNSSLHLLGLIGRSGVHAYNDHLYALLLLASKHHLNNVYLHLITDGRDSPPTDSLNQIKEVEDKINHYKIGQISSILGRYYAMDRDMRLDRTQLALNCLVDANSQLSAKSAIEAVRKSHSAQITDEFIKPISIGDSPKKSRIKSNDAVIFYNFRIDRPRQLTHAFLSASIPNLCFITMTSYHQNFHVPVAYPEEPINNTLGQIISANSLKQLRAAESEKERFVTYYFNGQKEEPFADEDRLIIPSPKIATYDLKPEMSTQELITAFSQKMVQNKYTLGVLNIACPDMVAHTGNLKKTKLAILAADQALANLIKLIDQLQGVLLITADHGNAEELFDINTNNIDTEHSTNPVPFILYQQNIVNIKLQNGILADVAPTLLSLLNIPQPIEMTGNSLILKNK